MWLIFALLSALFAALVAIFGKIGIKDIDTTLATTIRSIIMAAFLIAASFSFGKFKLIGHVNSLALKYIIYSGVAGALSWLFYFAALKTGLASRVAVIDRLSLVFVIVLAGLFLGETINAKVIIGMILIVAGAIIIVFQ